MLGLVLVLGTGCSSAPVALPQPETVRMADRMASDAGRLEQSGQWAAAADAWRSAADQYELLNRRDSQAVALHQLGRANRQLGRTAEAVKVLEQAAALNRITGQEGEWWRNQVALLQLEFAAGKLEVMEKRLEMLAPQTKSIADPSTRAHYLNEQGLWEMSRGGLDRAATLFREARGQFERAGNEAGLAAVLGNEGVLFEARSEFEAALRSWRAALTLCERLGDTQGIALALAGQGRAMVSGGMNSLEAETLLRRAARHFELLKNAEEAERAKEWLRRATEMNGGKAGAGGEAQGAQEGPKVEGEDR